MCKLHHSERTLSLDFVRILVDKRLCPNWTSNNDVESYVRGRVFMGQEWLLTFEHKRATTDNSQIGVYMRGVFGG